MDRPNDTIHTSGEEEPAVIAKRPFSPGGFRVTSLLSELTTIPGYWLEQQFCEPVSVSVIVSVVVSPGTIAVLPQTIPPTDKGASSTHTGSLESSIGASNGPFSAASRDSATGPSPESSPPSETPPPSPASGLIAGLPPHRTTSSAMDSESAAFDECDKAIHK